MSRGFAIDLGEWFWDKRLQVREDLERYFSGKAGDRFTGRWFERFAAIGDPNRFETSDVLAVESLSVKVPPESAAKLLVAEPDAFNILLKAIPSQRDLWELERSVVEPGNAAHNLHQVLDDLPKVGWVTAGKLMAAKRPRLIPVLDKEVKRLLKPPKGQFWGAMYDELSDERRRSSIAEVCANAPEEVSLLRRIDVALWMHAIQRSK